MIIILSITGIWPFGTKTILTSDLENQYVQFFSYLREIYKGNHSIFYTFSKTFGGEMLSLYAYYLMSPLNIILLFFRIEWLPQAIELLILIKISLCSLTFYFLISHLSAPCQTVWPDFFYFLRIDGLQYGIFFPFDVAGQYYSASAHHTWPSPDSGRAFSCSLHTQSGLCHSF